MPGLGCEPSQPRLGHVDLALDTQVQGRIQRLRRPPRPWVLHQPELVELVRLPSATEFVDVPTRPPPPGSGQFPGLAEAKRRGQRFAVADGADVQRPVQPVIVRRIEHLVARAAQVEKINQEVRPFRYAEGQYDMVVVAGIVTVLGHSDERATGSPRRCG